MFIQRENELKLLNFNYDQPFSSLQIIIGEKAIGKSALINYFSLGKRVLHISNFERIPNKFFSEMGNEISYFFKKSSLDIPLTNFKQVLEYLYKQEVKSKTVIVFDDFQNIIKYDKESIKTFIEIWNKKLIKKNIQVIISSSINFLTKNNLDKIVFDLIQLETLSFESIQSFLPTLNKLEQLYVYSLIGTSPKHLKYYNEKLNFTENLYNLFLNTNSYLYDYGFNILKTEISDVGTYCSILESIACGNDRIGSIAKELNVKSTYLSRYMQNLINMMIIKKEVPINENLAKSKFGKYLINDNALKFWFSYIYPNISLLEKNDTTNILKIIEDKFVNQTVFESYKTFIKEYVCRNEEELLGYKPLVIDSWWDNKENKIDLIAYDRKNITFIEILWKEKEIAKLAYEKLKNLSSKFKTTLSKRYIIVTKEMFLKKL